MIERKRMVGPMMSSVFCLENKTEILTAHTDAVVADLSVLFAPEVEQTCLIDKNKLLKVSVVRVPIRTTLGLV